MKLIMRITNKFFIAVLVTFLGSGCSYNILETPVDCDQYGLELALANKADANCGQADGSIEVTASGGSGTYTFYVNQVEQSGALIQDLSAGSYEIEVSDGVCTSVLAVDVLNKDGLNISVAATDAGCNANEGTITVSQTSGVEPVTYSLDGNSFAEVFSFQGLSSGDHTILAKDAAGCEVSQTVTLNTGVSYATTIGPLIANNCAVTGCHAGSQPPDLRTLTNIQQYAERVKVRTANGSMPLGRTLTQAENDAIACWVDDGALNN